jgi:hypothetical protein
MVGFRLNAAVLASPHAFWQKHSVAHAPSFRRALSDGAGWLLIGVPSISAKQSIVGTLYAYAENRLARTHDISRLVAVRAPKLTFRETGRHP